MTTELPDLLGDLRGVFAAVVLADDGDGWVAADPIGHRSLYYGENDAMVVVATRAALAARALAPRGTPPERDGESACVLALTTYRVGASTGYRDVRVAEPGSRLRIDADGPRWIHDDPFTIGPDDPLRTATIDELAELVLDDVADGVRQILEQPAERHVLNLTGGKDSRVILAAAMRAGLADDLEYETIGPPQLADVVLAESLADEFGLRHRVLFFGLKPDEPYPDRVASFIDRTGGMVSGWDLWSDPPSTGLYITGLCGELLRSCTRVPGPIATPSRIGELFSPGRVGRLGLLETGLDKQLRAELVERITVRPDPSAHPLDRAQAHFATSRMRFTRLGAPLELDGGRRLHPLYSPLALRAAMSLDAEDRQSEILVASMLRLASMRLVEHRFTDAGWDAHARGRLDWLAEVDQDDPAPAAAAAAHTPQTSAEPPAAAGKAKPLMATLFAKGANERTEFLAESFSDASNSTWDRIDRDRSLDALARWEELKNSERQELFGAATAARWTAGNR